MYKFVITIQYFQQNVYYQYFIPKALFNNKIKIVLKLNFGIYPCEYKKLTL